MLAFVNFLFATAHLPVDAIRVLGLIPFAVLRRTRALGDFEDVSRRSIVVVVRLEADLILTGSKRLD